MSVHWMSVWIDFWIPLDISLYLLALFNKMMVAVWDSRHACPNMETN